MEDIKITKNDNYTCLSFKAKNINLYDVCSNEEGFFYPNNTNEFQKNDTYKNIQIDSLENHKFLLWNYHEFVYLSPKKNTTISLFNKDLYKLNLIYQTKDYLLVPDYNNDYQFSKINLITFKNGKTSEIKLRYDLYFDSYFLGDYKNKVYLYDNKSELEYYIDLKKKDIYKTEYKYVNTNDKNKTTTLLESIKNGNEDEIKYIYDELGNIKEIYKGNNIIVNYYYDELGQVIRENNKEQNKTKK